MIRKMHEQYMRLVSEMRECGLFHETDPNLGSARLEFSLYEDCKSSFPLESSFVDDIPYTDLEEAPDPPLTSSSLVAPSSTSTPIGTTVSALTLHASSLHLAQCTRLEIGEPFRGDVSVLEDDFPTWSIGPPLVELHLEEAPFEELCDDSFVVGAALSIEHIGSICTGPLDLTPHFIPFPFHHPLPLACIS